MDGGAGWAAVHGVAMSWKQLSDFTFTFMQWVLDVGQGQAVLLQSEGKTFLVDCGGDYDTGAADTTAQRLLSQGVSNLDGVIVTHYDRDHCGGLPYLLTRMQTQTLFVPYAEDPDGIGETMRSLTDGTVTTVKEDLVLT